MEQLMNDIKAVFGLKKNQNLTFDEKMVIVELKIKQHLETSNTLAYKRGVKTSLTKIESLYNNL